MFEKEIKVSQFADDTNLFCADLSSVEKGLQIVAILLQLLVLSEI